MANHDHAIRLTGADTVVLASSLIPGNEDSVNRVINALTREGVSVIHKGNALVHVSGHAAAGELRYVYNIVKPRYVVPVHGEWRHMHANARIARSVGIPTDHVIVIDDGVSVDLGPNGLRVSGYQPVGHIYVDGASVGDLTEAQLKDRRILGEEGFISIVTVVDIPRGVIVAGPEMHARGFAADIDLEGITEQVRATVTEALAGGAEDTHEISQRVRRTVGRWVSSQHRRRPMIVPIVIEG
jgi:ribonuclease J